MKPKAQGFILFITLIVVAVMSLLVLTSMQHVLLYYRAINRQEQMHRDFYQLEQVALQIARRASVSAIANCVMQKDAANQSLQKLVQKAGCSLKKDKINYQYVIEDLGEFPCLVVPHKGQNHATYHRRISIAQMEEGFPASMIQIRFIKVGSILNCPNNARKISLGLSSWRYLASI